MNYITCARHCILLGKHKTFIHENNKSILDFQNTLQNNVIDTQFS